MPPRYVCFDLETARAVDFDAPDPLCPCPGVSVAATLTDSGDLTLWHGPAPDPGGPLAPEAPADVLAALVDYLQGLQGSGAHVITWNGLAFDFPVLAGALPSPELQPVLRALARGHIDIGFHMLCDLGYMLGLDRAAQACGLAPKPLNGAEAPALWSGPRAQQEAVLDYVAHDVRALREVYEVLTTRGLLRWTARSGRLAEWWPGTEWTGRHQRLLTVTEALCLPRPAPRRGVTPWSRERFLAWLQRGPVEATA